MSNQPQIKAPHPLLRFVLQINDGTTPYDLWVTLYNKIADITDIGVKLYQPPVYPPATFLNGYSVNKILNALKQVEGDEGVDETHVQELSNIVHEYANSYYSSHRGFTQTWMSPSLSNRPYGFPQPPCVVPPQAPVMYPWSEPSHETLSGLRFPTNPLLPPEQTPIFGKPPLATFQMRKQMELEQLKNELQQQTDVADRLAERIKYLQAKIKAIEALPEE